MGPSNFAVVKCFNTSKKLKDFCEKQCKVHAGLLKGSCGCPQPYRLYMFPSIKKNHEKRQDWIQLLNRVKSDKSEWKPCGNDRVCSEHFVDGIPTVENPNLTLKLGFAKQSQGELYSVNQFTKRLRKHSLSVTQINSQPALHPLHHMLITIIYLQQRQVSCLILHQHHLNFYTSCRQCLQNITIIFMSSFSVHNKCQPCVVIYH